MNGLPVSENMNRTAASHSVTAVLYVMLFLAPLTARAAQAAPEHAEMLRYHLACTINENRASLECEAEVWVRVLRDSLASVSWNFPASASVRSIRDETDNTIKSTQGVASPDGASYDVVCSIPPHLSVNDSVMFRIRYAAAADTSSFADSFIGRREFLLQSRPLSGWAPMISGVRGSSAKPHAPVRLDVLISSEFRIVAGGTVDSLFSRGASTVWRIVRDDAAGWDESFCVAGSKDVQPVSAPGASGMCGVTLYTDPSVFHSGFAASLTSMLGAASRYYALQQYRPRYNRLTFACIGAASLHALPVKSGNLVIVRNSPAFGSFDSSMFTSTMDNVWLHETARVYAFDVPDSSYWFNESWAGYLSTRFLFAGADPADHLQYNERSHLVMRALDFFPTYPIAAGRSSGLNEDAVFLYKGRYVFMMLEYILGAESFDGVMRDLYGRSRTSPPSIAALQELCEAAYGSPLSWFFDQWLYRTGFPEYALTSETVASPRGTFDVTVTVTQRGDLFAMPLNISFETAGRSVLKRIFMKEEQQRFTFTFSSMPTKIDWNPRYLVLRWIPRFRIMAHARTSVSFRVFNRDIAASEREAELTLQLDPDNNVGANGISLFSLGKAAGTRKDWVKAAEYFLKASQQRDPVGSPSLPLLGLVRHGNVLELLGSREAAIGDYRRALEAAERNPLLYAPVIIEARRFLDQPFTPDDAAWYQAY